MSISADKIFKPYIINMVEMPIDEDSLKNTLIVFAQDAVQAHRLGYLLGAKMYNVNNEDELIAHHQDVAISNSSFLVTGCQITFDEIEDLTVMESFSDQIHGDYESVNKQSYMVVMYKLIAESQEEVAEKYKTSEDVMSKGKRMGILFAFAPSEQHVNEMVSIWAENAGVINKDKDFYVNFIMDVFKPFGLWNPDVEFFIEK